MVEALWVQASGVSYTAAEDRKLINSIYTDGVISGLGLSIGSGLNVNVAAGYAAIPDGSGGTYLAALDSSTPVAITANTGSTIFLTVDPTSGACTVAAGSLPATPYIALGSGYAGPSTVTSVSWVNNRTQAAFRATAGQDDVDASYVSKTGDTMTGTLTAPGVVATTSMLAQAFLIAQQGITLGGASNPLKRANARVSGTGQVVTANAQSYLSFPTVNRNVSDYSSAFRPAIIDVGNSIRFYAPISGVYLFSVDVSLGTIAGANTIHLGLTTFNSTGTYVRDNWLYQDQGSVSSSVIRVSGSYALPLTASQWVQIQFSSGNTRTLGAANATATLLQAD